MVEAQPRKKLKVLILEPYYGGSHKSFIEGLKHLPFTFEVLSLPSRKWKWRMRLSAPYYARQLHRDSRRFDRILCSTFVDVAAFRGMAPAWVRDVPLLTYFHENQFVYPVQVEDERDFHFALTNVTTALASDSLAFNSSYNLSTFLEGMGKLLKMSHDLKLSNAKIEIKSKSRVIHPGIDFTSIDKKRKTGRNKFPVILWNHRWEHDKDPEKFFEALFMLDRKEIDFRIILLGQSFKDYPPIFDKALSSLSHRITHSGYVKSRKEYAQLLSQGTIAVSTAKHEFFGISMVEALRAGCRLLVPNRLSYPELFPEEFLYDERDFFNRLQKETLNNDRLAPDSAGKLTDSFSWDSIAPKFEKWITDAEVRKAL
jgi:glycosyltransferase involved in cell wall biosynthesis